MKKSLIMGLVMTMALMAGCDNTKKEEPASVSTPAPVTAPAQQQTEEISVMEVPTDAEEAAEVLDKEEQRVEHFEETLEEVQDEADAESMELTNDAEEVEVEEAVV